MIQELLKNHLKEMAVVKDNLIREAINKAGYDANDIEFLKQNLQCVEYAANDFQHFYIEGKRIISIQKNPEIEPASFINSSYKQTISYRYY